jgi:uncharacterized protein YbaR (Trm112 family)
MKRRLVEHLRCPATGEKLHLRGERADNTGEILAGALVSESGRTYEIEDGIPILIDHAQFSHGQEETVESFSEKWRRAPDYREATRHHYVQWYLERYGFGTLEGLKEFLAGKRRVLEAGTGHGRDAEMYATHCAGEVFALDISSGIRLAYRDLSHLPNVHFVQADLRHPPFPERFFDFIACDQVIHHTPDTFESLRALTRYLGDGHIAFYVYKVKAAIRELADDFIRSHTTKMTPDDCMEFSEQLTALGKALAELKVTVDIPVDIPLLGIEKGEFDIQRWIYWNFLKCYWNETIDWKSNAITNFDWYHPLHAHRHTPDEVRGWIDQCKLVAERFSVVESGISVLARRD